MASDDGRAPKNMRAIAAGVVVAALFVPLLINAASGVARTSASAAMYQYAGKVTICHHTHSAKNPAVTITISSSALPAHLRHGDTVGPCGKTSASAPTTTHKGGEGHGNGGGEGHGNSGHERGSGGGNGHGNSGGNGQGHGHGKP